MKRLSKSGERLFHAINFKIYIPNTDTAIRRRIAAEPGTGMTKAHMADFMAAAALEIADAFPQHQFRMVQVSETDFNFVPTGSRVDIPAIPKDLAQSQA